MIAIGFNKLYTCIRQIHSKTNGVQNIETLVGHIRNYCKYSEKGKNRFFFFNIACSHALVQFFPQLETMHFKPETQM